ncbi:MAG: DUF456 domain-containing protein [Bacteroidales bacterium]|nr:DUF456 domain-containing protein [Bacteroidales bacterium]
MTTLEIFAIILAVLGIIGSIVPGIPGPPLSWVGLFLQYLAKGDDPVSTTTLIIFLVAATVVTVLDYVLPPTFTRALGGHKAAATGAVIGLFVGMFLTPIGMIMGSILGAFIAELVVEDRGVWESFKASIGAFLGFIITTGMKLILCGWIFLIIIKHVL